MMHGSYVLFFFSLSVSSRRYAITVWYFDADERAKAKEKYLTGKKKLTSYIFVLVSLPFFFVHPLLCNKLSLYFETNLLPLHFSDYCAGAGEKGLKVELNKLSDPS